MIEVTVCLCCC